MILGALSAETITALAAFFSGIGTVITGYLAVRWERKRSREECEDRIRAMREGMILRDRIDQGKPMVDEDESSK